MIAQFKKTITDTVAEFIGLQSRKRKPLVTPDSLGLCDQSRALKKRRGGLDGAKDYIEIKERTEQERRWQTDLDIGSVPGSGSKHQKDQQHESMVAR